MKRERRKLRSLRLGRLGCCGGGVAVALLPGGGRAPVVVVDVAGGVASEAGAWAGLLVAVAWIGPVGTPATEPCFVSAYVRYTSPLAEFQM
jgi:hypothetical protein